MTLLVVTVLFTWELICPRSTRTVFSNWSLGSVEFYYSNRRIWSSGRLDRYTKEKVDLGTTRIIRAGKGLSSAYCLVQYALIFIGVVKKKGLFANLVFSGRLRVQIRLFDNVFHWHCVTRWILHGWALVWNWFIHYVKHWYRSRIYMYVLGICTYSWPKVSSICRASYKPIIVYRSFRSMKKSGV